LLIGRNCISLDGSTCSESLNVNTFPNCLLTKLLTSGTTERLVIEMEANFDGLEVALAQSEEASISALEKLLTSFLSASDQMNIEKLAKVEKVLPVSDSGPDVSSPLANHSQDLFSSSSLGVSKFASRVVNILKKGGYEMFMPLTKLPSEKLTIEENMSLTSTFLRLYVRNSHPQLCQLLVAWHQEGLAVGPRLLCHVSRCGFLTSILQLNC
jgi:hypothetical protein